MPTPTIRDLPAVHLVLESPILQAVRNHIPAADLRDAVRAELDACRAAFRAGQSPSLEIESLAKAALVQLESRSQPHLRPVINATGIVLHTNLGRSCLAESAAAAAGAAGRGTLNLELDLDSGRRAHRADAVREELKRITGAESGTVVNNCAAATMIVLKALAAGREVIVSRGQLVEIGGSFRLPEIMAASGAILKEVGSTNITRRNDYERAISANTALILRVHPSNYRIRGFTETPEIGELATLGKSRGIPVVDDVGSGLALDLTPFGLPPEPTVADGIRAGADLVLFSGDKLLGGPQAGLIAGRANLIRRIESDPLMRALRVDKMTLAALEATLRLYRDPARAVRELPTLRLLTATVHELQERAHLLVDRLKSIPRLSLDIRADETYAGGGSLPDHALPTVVVAVSIDGLSEEQLAYQLRTGTPAVVARIQRGSVVLDMRTIEIIHFDEIVKGITNRAIG